MAKDIRKLFEQERNRPQASLPKGHEDRFLQRLEKELPQKKNRRQRSIWLRVAAASLLLLCIGWGSYYAWKHSQSTPEVATIATDASKAPGNPAKTNISPEASAKKQLTLSDISPDLKKVETYFISSIKGELASLKVSEEEQEMVDAYLTKIKELGKEYDNLNQELNTIGVNDMTITALIENLKLRLQLLQRLKKNLNYSKKDTYEKKTSDNI